MRNADVRGSNSSAYWRGAMRLSLVALGIGLVMAVGAARAQDDEDEEKTFDEKFIEGIMTGLGGTNMENRGIDYRERSPLVVPPKLDLPPPAQASQEINAPNWPKDPDEARRKATAAANRKKITDPFEAARPLKPSELNPPGTRVTTSSRRKDDGAAPGEASNNIVLSPSQLGVKTSFSSIFGPAKNESAPFKGESVRDSLTQPPSGYQTPSPNYAYGTGEVDWSKLPTDPITGKPK